MNSHVDEFIQCPYEPSHTFPRGRLQTHLIKCQKQHKDVKSECCPYNTTHVFTNDEITEHKKTCKNKLCIEYFFNKEAQQNSSRKYNIVPVTALNNIELPDSTESWDEETGISPLDIIEVTKYEKNVLLPCIGESKSVRKQHRISERQRLAELSNISKKQPKKEKTYSQYQEENQYAKNVDDTEDSAVTSTFKQKNVGYQLNEAEAGQSSLNSELKNLTIDKREDKTETTSGSEKIPWANQNQSKPVTWSNITARGKIGNQNDKLPSSFNQMSESDFPTFNPGRGKLRLIRK